jgi:hypothetical protein
MTHTLVLEIPEEVYEPLLKTAEQSGQTPEDTAVGWLKNAAKKSSDDPVEKFIGTLGSDIPDWADEHDKYIGQEIMKKMSGEAQKGD